MNIPLRRRFRLFLYITGALAFSIGTGVLAYMATTERQEQPHIRIQTEHPASVPAVMAAVRSSLLANFTYLHSTTSSSQTTGYQLTGYHFRVILPLTNNLTFLDQQDTSEQATYNQLAATLPAVTKVLSQQGFPKAGMSRSSTGLLSAVYFYRRSNAVCQLTIYTNLAITCSPISQLQTIAVQANSLVAEYQAAAPGLGVASVTAPTFQASETATFSIASMDVFNTAGETKVLFYKQDSGTWQMVHLNWYNDPHEDGDIIPNCEDFESVPAVQQAFRDQPCYNATLRTETTIL
jgi:hypothetical protein